MPEISELAFDFGTLIPALVFAALAAVLPELYKFLARKFLGRIKNISHPGCTFCWKAILCRLR